MKKIVLSALALVALASCSKDNETVDPDVVSITSGITTRASGTKWASGDLIGVFATEVTEAKSEVGKSNSQYKASTSGEKSTFTPIDYIYYPPTANIDIMAYYPYADGTTATAYDVDVLTNQDKHYLIDLMTAKAENQAKSSSAIELTFDHKLSQIEVTLVAKENGGFVDSDLAGATVTVGGTIVEASYNLSDNAITFDKEADATNLTLEASSNVATFIVIPQKSTLKFTIKVDGVYYEVTASELTMDSGNTYTYEISVSKTEVKITGSKINDWGTGTGDSLDASDYVAPDIALVGDTYQIYTAAGLSAFASIVNEGADVSGLNTAGIEDTSIDQNTYAKGQLMNDIDLSTVCYAVDDEDGVSWTPIGKDGASFFGTFDGDNYTISGLYINSTSNYQGLFGYVDSSTIGNVNVEGSVVAASYVGGIVGGKNQYSAVTISNCSYSGSVNGSGDYVGGIIGYSTGNYNCKISNCVNNSTVKADGSYVGGITGYSYSMYGYVQYCGNNGDVTAKTSYAGGISGCNPLGYMRYNYNKGSIAATSYVGGIVGSQYAVGANTSTNGGYSGVTYNYNTGSVTGDSNVGGIVGIIGGYYSIQYCYNSGSVTSNNNSYFGGIYGSYVSSGYGSGTSVTVTNSYYASDKISSSPTYTAGTAILSTEMLDGTFAEKLGSSYQEDVASNINDGYPILVWQVATE